MKAEFEALGWGPLVNPEHDLGTDLYCQVRDRRRFDLGLFVGVQVKSGPSYFEEAVVGKDGDVEGWWYWEEDGDHFDYWIDHTIPHLIVLRDLDKHRSYWARVTAESVVSTGKGNKILVPANQLLDESSRDALVDIAAEQRASYELEGTAWRSGVGDLAPGQHFRFALLAPRLVAPHRNAGHGSPVSAVEAVALLAQGRVRDLEIFAEKHAEVPQFPKGATTHRDWGWRFAGAIWHWVVDAEVNALHAALDSAPDEPRRAAAAVTLACALIGEEEVDRALSVIDGTVTEDESEPVDHAWLLVHRGRLRAEIGDYDGARVDALGAALSLVGDAGDVSASVIRGAAASLLWLSLEWQERDVGDLITSTDNAVSWWRSQAISWALTEATQRAFSSWVDDRATRFVAEDLLHNGLLAAALGSNLSGEHGRWRSEVSLFAKHILLEAGPAGDAEGVEDGLDSLRACGDADSLRKAVRWLRRVGPLDAVRGAVARVGRHRWTHTTCEANLVLWAKAGDLLDAEDATDAARFCLAALGGNTPEDLVRSTPRFHVPMRLLDALGGLLLAADDDVSRATVELLTQVPEKPDPATVPELRRVVRSLRPGALGEQERSVLANVSRRVDDADFSAAVLGRLVASGDDPARQELLRRADSGDLDALGELGDVRLLSEEAAIRLIQTFDRQVGDVVRSSHDGVYSMGRHDPLRGLAVLNLWFPEVASWETLLNALDDEALSARDKAGACDVLASGASRLPDGVAEQIRGMLGRLAATQRRWLPGEEESLEGVAGFLALALAHDDDATLTRLATGGPEQRASLADALAASTRGDASAMLAVLAGDSDVEVRTRATVAAARRLGDGKGGALKSDVVLRSVHADGVATRNAVLRGFALGQQFGREHRDVVEPLMTHPSAEIRARTEALMGREDHR